MTTQAPRDEGGAVSGLSEGEREALAEALLPHGPGGLYSSTEQWIECLCGERLPCRLGWGGYPLDADDEGPMWARHRADALAPTVARIVADRTRVAERDRDLAEQQATNNAEDAIVLQRERDEARERLARVEALVSRWEVEAAQRGPGDTILTGGTAAMLRAALGGGHEAAEGDSAASTGARSDEQRGGVVADGSDGERLTEAREGA